ncbi:VCBS domain-containing protein, partial [Mesorhizobium sp. M8A.F.Ca.ET.218.01.1.1]|uniref:VCBS domain-containing protein n=1 Tax=Mesorhizobium sp. M8A.F.Ca.ET.218.01.1.1 TaxID=2563971 RepID=UPI001093EC38
ASDNLLVHVVDDVPTAHDDGPYAVVEDGAGAANTPPTSTVSGDVLTNDVSGADTPKGFVAWSGADAAAITALNTYGTLTQNANGTWSYVLDNSKAATQALTSGSHLSYDLHYTMTDADGDTSSAKLTITVNGADDTASVVTASAQGADNTVYEAGLNPDGSNAASSSETSTGSFTIAASDGIKEIVIGGTTFSFAQVQGFNGSQTVNTGEGT